MDLELEALYNEEYHGPYRALRKYCYNSENYEIMMRWTCSCDGKDTKYIRNFGGGNLLENGH